MSFKSALCMLLILLGADCAVTVTRNRLMEKLVQSRLNQQCDAKANEVHETYEQLAYSIGQIRNICPWGSVGNAKSDFGPIDKLMKCIEAGGQGEMTVPAPTFPARSPCPPQSPLLLVLAIVGFTGFFLAAGGLAALVAHIHFQKK